MAHTCGSACVCVCESTNRFDFDPDTATRQRQRQRQRLWQRQCHRKVEVEDEVEVEVAVAVRVNDCTMQMRNEETNFTTCLTAVCLSVRASAHPSACQFICLARSSLPHAVARHPCPALPCPAAPWLAVQVRRLRLRLRLGRMHYYLRVVKCKQDVRASHKAV